MEYRVDKMMEWEDGESRRVVGKRVKVSSTTSPTVLKSGREPVAVLVGNITCSIATSSSQISYDQHEIQDQPTDLSKKKQDQLLPLKLRKHKTIPPPLDLSINLSLHHNNHPLVTQIQSQQTHHHNHQQQQSPSPKHNDKNLPLRKRWHSWSPVPMNGQDESSMVPLYPDGNNTSPKTGLAGVETAVTTQPNSNSSNSTQNQYHHHHHHLPPYQNSPGGHGGHTYTASGRWLEFVPVSTPTTTTSSNNSGITSNRPTHSNSSNSNGHINGHHAHSGTSSNGDLQTPTPFYTPNEPSPKFMNSPVFSYSNPDTALYQGPFSPMRASSLYPPPSSPFTNLSLNSPLLPLSSAGGGGGGGSGNQSSSCTPISSMSSSSSSSCFNMIPSTLLSPAPSQASTNSLSYEDLHEKSLNFFQPAWSIFTAGTKIRFVTGMNSMDWYPVDFLAQGGDSLGLKGEYAPHGLEVRKFIVTSSAKERIQLTFYPVGDPHHPTIEVNCEPGHPFMVDKKGWCAVKPEVFHEIYGTQCQPLECGDVCLNISAARSPNQNQANNANHNSQSQYQAIQHHHHHSHSAFPSHINHNGNNHNQLHQSIKMEQIDVKPVPISILPQTQISHHLIHSSSSMGMNSSSSAGSPNNGASSIMNANPNAMISRKTFASPMSNSPAKKAKESKTKKASNAGNNNANVGENKGRRPMNGFLLFAKDKRPELIQMYPGKDNRSISVLLGEAWQTLDPTEREKYSLNAKVRAEEQKRIHPDCWKRKRSQSINS